jgi:hypothetical protein
MIADSHGVGSMTDFDLGTFSRRLDNTPSKAQVWFDRGLIW